MALIDLCRATLGHCNSLGPAECVDLGVRLRDGKMDNTHLGPKGKATIAMAARELIRLFPDLERRRSHPV